MNRKKKVKKGFALVTVLALMALISVLSLFFINFTITDLKISFSLNNGTQALYLAEAGVEEMVWWVKHDEQYKTEFEEGTINRTLSRSNLFGGDSGYEVKIEASGKAQAQITSRGIYQISGRQATRLVKVKIFKALAQGTSWSQVSYGAKDIDFFASRANLNGGPIYAVDDVDVWGGSIVNVEKDVLAGDQITVGLFSQLNVSGAKHSQNYPPPPDPIVMPQIDFDSDDPHSYLSQAQANGTVYTEQQFKDLLEDHSPVTLNGVVYVKGNIDIKKNQSLTVNGVLVADGNISVGLLSLVPPSGSAQLTINAPPDGSPSGLLAKGKIKIGAHATDTTINGLIYALDEIHFFDFTSSIVVNGGLIARQVSIFSIWQPVTINLDEERVERTLQPTPSYSPTVEVEYWEEEY